jgi:hypothetical protein
VLQSVELEGVALFHRQVRQSDLRAELYKVSPTT